MMVLRKLRVQIRLYMIVGVALVGVLSLVTMSLFFLQKDLRRERELKTRHLVEVAYSVVGSYREMVTQGKLSDPQARKLALAAVKAMRYGNDDYFWVHDLQGRMVMHPFRSELEGTDVSQLKDAAGKGFILASIEMVRTHGAGFIYYLWPKPGSDQPVQKLSYVKGFTPWGWVIGSGVYLDDVYALFWQSARHYAMAGGAIFLAITAMSLCVARSIARTEESLRLSEEKFSKAFEASPDGYAISRREDGRYIEVNEAFCREIGYARDEILGRTSHDLGIWGDPAQRGQLIERLDRDGTVSNFEAAFRIKGGGVRHVLCSCDPIVLKGDPCLIVIVHDVTRRKQRERELLKGKAELALKHEQLSCMFRTAESIKRDWERTIDCIDDQVILLDAQGRVKRCNRSTARFAARTQESLHGLEWSVLARSNGVPELGSFERAAEFYHEGTQRWFSCTYYPGDLDPRGPGGGVITIHDMTESKRAALELGKAYSELQLTQSQMLQQEKMASIGQLAAGVAHEINNPTGFVMSNLGTLGKYGGRLLSFIAAQDEALGTLNRPELTERLAGLRRQLKIDRILADLPSLVTESLEGIERVKSIVQNLKGFSRADDSQCQLTDLKDCIESTINIVWNELKYKVTLKREYGELPPIPCYPQQINQVIMNLLVNAAHAIDTQGEITVRTWRDGETACLAVSDTGCGIAEQHRARIFEPFFTTKEVGKGTGLGLSISFNIVKKHGGDIAVLSEPGRGTTFTVTLPMRSCQAAA